MFIKSFRFISVGLVMFVAVTVCAVSASGNLLEKLQEKVTLQRQGKEQGTLEERRAHCSHVGGFSDPVPYSPHLTVHYIVTKDMCYRKEPDLAPHTNTIAIQRVDGAKLIPILRIIKHYHYTDDGWPKFKSSIKSEYGSENYREISADAVPLFSHNLKEHIQPGDVVQITNCGETGKTCYYFTDHEGMFYYMKHNFEEGTDETAVYVDYN